MQLVNIELREEHQHTAVHVAEVPAGSAPHSHSQGVQTQNQTGRSRNISRHHGGSGSGGGDPKVAIELAIVASYDDTEASSEMVGGSRAPGPAAMLSFFRVHGPVEEAVRDRC